MASEAFQRQLEAMSAQYRRELPGKLAELDALWRGLTTRALQPARLADLRRELHSLAGSARTFGVAGVGEAAAAAESFLEPFVGSGCLPDPAARAEFEQLLDAVKRTATAR